ncbi:MAG: hypothetical protein ACK2UE_16305 [Anaerolineales bacterium]|jgi:hypothetical protein
MMISQEVYSAFQSQRQPDLMQAAQISRFLRDGQKYPREPGSNPRPLIARYRRRLLSARTWFSNQTRKEVKDEEGLVVGDRLQSI